MSGLHRVQREAGPAREREGGEQVGVRLVAGIGEHERERAVAGERAFAEELRRRLNAVAWLV